MSDMLVKLYELPELAPALEAATSQGVVIRPARLPEKPKVVSWMQGHFRGWAAEVEATFAQVPVSCFLALKESDVVGFACYDSLCPNFFGPTAVVESERSKGIGRALLLSTLHAQRSQGYAYAIIGDAGPADYYVKAVGAVRIEGSDPGIYEGLLL